MQSGAPSLKTSAAEIAHIFDRLRRAHARLRARPIDDILFTLEGLIALWLRPDSPWRQRAEDALPAATGFSPEMIRFGLPWMLEPLRGTAVAELLAAELGDRDALDIFVAGRRAVGPAVVLHVLAGNLPGAATVPITLSLAVKSCPFVKTAHGDRVFPALFAESIAAVDPDLGECVGVCYWPGGDYACEERAFAGAELVVASGEDATIADLQSRCPVRFIGHGHKVSVGVLTTDVVTSPATARTVAAALALDVSVWDQRGCLSPQICFVEGDFDTACGFAALLASELAALAEQLPPGTRTLAEHAAIRRFRDEAEWKQAG